eukprot:3319800-Rhodomonas_salina.1
MYQGILWVGSPYVAILVLPGYTYPVPGTAGPEHTQGSRKKPSSEQHIDSSCVVYPGTRVGYPRSSTRKDSTNLVSCTPYTWLKRSLPCDLTSASILDSGLALRKKA